MKSSKTAKGKKASPVMAKSKMHRSKVKAAANKMFTS